MFYIVHCERLTRVLVARYLSHVERAASWDQWRQRAPCAEANVDGSESVGVKW